MTIIPIENIMKNRSKKLRNAIKRKKMIFNPKDLEGKLYIIISTTVISKNHRLYMPLGQHVLKDYLEEKDKNICLIISVEKVSKVKWAATFLKGGKYYSFNILKINRYRYCFVIDPFSWKYYFDSESDMFLIDINTFKIAYGEDIK